MSQIIEGTRAKYLHLTDEVHTQKEAPGRLFKGEYEENGVVFHCLGDDGKLHDNSNPAIFEIETSHSEHWENGKLHRIGGPAVYDLYGNYKEYWENGIRIK